MSVWRVGMEAVCIHDGLWRSTITGEIYQSIVEKGDVFIVARVMKRPRDQTSLWKRTFGKKAIYLAFKAFPDTWFEAVAFRPAQRSNSEIIARIKACRPARKPVEA
ncbi:hypothetical protein GCM10007897_43720 [Sphingobium jiangsuense]|uniref:Uncharacterized protein n=1 Tax=Sphingobium jiangsuense TaxID=870476 RepID=A0A7W6BM09_9SPHN|nr:hypothetical protein [Sphingobium jiangsuense]MBB3928294.1 hypothetical protein [Sphingobium jiangsuense]GLT02942.1 hypothetical protein GCM10007897_43720 [Sphingobium jiangsuense]